MSDGVIFVYTPQELFNKIGFDSIQKLKEYGKLLNKEYIGENVHDAYKFIFDIEIEATINRRNKLFPDPPAVIILPPNPKVITLGFLINIGPSDNSFKINDIVFSVPNLNLLKPTNKNTTLQITPIIESEVFHDQISINIRHYRFENDNIRLSTNSFRSNNESWGINLKAFLNIFIYDTDILNV